MIDTPANDDSSSTPLPDDGTRNGDGRHKPPQRRDQEERHEMAEEQAIRFRRFLAEAIARRILRERRGIVGPDQPTRGE